MLPSPPMPLLLRVARRSDLPAIYRLLAEAFPEAPHLFVPQTEHDPTFRFRHARVAIVDGRVVAYVRTFARRMLVRGVPLSAGGIGSVATSPDVRNSGYATLLLEDANREMERDGMAISFLFTGIPGFYERLGYRVVPEPYFEMSRAEVARSLDAHRHEVRAIRPADAPQLLVIYRRAIAGKTGAILRTRRAWDVPWLEETAGFVATDSSGEVVGYIRSRCRPPGRPGLSHQILEAECMPGADGAIEDLLAAVARYPCDCGDKISVLAPDASALAHTLRRIGGTAESPLFEHPMMLRPIAGRVDDSIFDEPVYFWNSDRI